MGGVLLQLPRRQEFDRCAVRSPSTGAGGRLRLQSLSLPFTMADVSW
ncbi:hypothetical protein AB9Q10_00615 [Streptomyces krungchingensis]